MGQQVTIATHNGSAVRQAHNLRTQACVAKETHIDPDGVHETWKHETLRHAYARIFGAAQEAYNARQPRPERRIKNYLAMVQQDEKKHPCYEMVIGIYGCPQNRNPVCKRIMSEFVASWQQRNPNLELIGAYYHADEKGKPHVHLDYIPVAHGYKKGMSTQTGLVKALAEMGFVKHGRETAQMQWQARENAELEQLCMLYGFDVAHPQKGQGVQHLQKKRYQAEQELQRINAITNDAYDEYLQWDEDAKEARIELQAVQQKLQASKQQLASQRAAMAQLEEDRMAQEQLLAHVDRQLQQAREDVQKARDDAKEARAVYKAFVADTSLDAIIDAATGDYQMYLEQRGLEQDFEQWQERMQQDMQPQPKWLELDEEEWEL